MVETFSLADRVQSSDLNRSVEKPSKDPANPIIPAAGSTPGWDRGKSYMTAIYKDGTYHALAFGTDPDTADSQFVCYMTSTDGETWTKPNLGRVSWDGNTDNNITLAATGCSFLYDSTLNKWVLVVERTSSSNMGVLLYTADAPDGPYTQVKDLDAGGVNEGRSIVRRPDGRWLAYYSYGHVGNDRRQGAWLSDTTDLAGAWTKYTNVIVGTPTTNQVYGVGVERYGDDYIGIVMRYDASDALEDGSTGSIWIELWASRDGLSWSQVDPDWLPLGADGAWDDSMVLSGFRFAEVGNTWELWYCGSPSGHSNLSSFQDRAWGRAAIQRRRLVAYTGTGTLTTRLFDVFDGFIESAATVNVDASDGTVNIEVQDAYGDPVPGYALADFDTITSDVYDHTPTWGGQALPQLPELRLHFEVVASSLYGYTIIRD